ncbi:hypothetical protein GDO78_021697 [Eleutherodactylus coqui]|uniref:Uncharacterized protein n=1 Tax=Eleutherodactylus coqui TaxID=57060 RepID=A0A8J6JYR7_ELECQ|nr:hypothetical protein GDO78_021697 [Eleutherodactylus coqui]
MLPKPIFNPFKGNCHLPTEPSTKFLCCADDVFFILVCSPDPALSPAAQKSGSSQIAVWTLSHRLLQMPKLEAIVRPMAVKTTPRHPFFLPIHLPIEHSI